MKRMHWTWLTVLLVSSPAVGEVTFEQVAPKNTVVALSVATLLAAAAMKEEAEPAIGTYIGTVSPTLPPTLGYIDEDFNRVLDKHREIVGNLIEFEDGESPDNAPAEEETAACS